MTLNYFGLKTQIILFYQINFIYVIIKYNLMIQLK